MAISLSPVILRERPSNVNCDPFEVCLDVLVHQAPTFGSSTSAGGTDDTL